MTKSITCRECEAMAHPIYVDSAWPLCLDCADRLDQAAEREWEASEEAKADLRMLAREEAREWERLEVRL